MSIDTILTLSNKEKIYTSIGDTCTMPSYDDNLLNITKELLAPAMTWNILDKQSSAVITRSNITWSFTHHCREWGRISIRGWTLYRTLAGELWGVFREWYGENWLRYYSTALYIYIYIWIYVDRYWSCICLNDVVRGNPSPALSKVCLVVKIWLNSNIPAQFLIIMRTASALLHIMIFKLSEELQTCVKCVTIDLGNVFPHVGYQCPTWTNAD